MCTVCIFNIKNNLDSVLVKYREHDARYISSWCQGCVAYALRYGSRNE